MRSLPDTSTHDQQWELNPHQLGHMLPYIRAWPQGAATMYQPIWLISYVVPSVKDSRNYPLTAFPANLSAIVAEYFRTWAWFSKSSTPERRIVLIYISIFRYLPIQISKAKCIMQNCDYHFCHVLGKYYRSQHISYFIWRHVPLIISVRSAGLTTISMSPTQNETAATVMWSQHDLTQYTPA